MIVKKRCANPSCREFVEDMKQGYCNNHKGSTDKEYNKWRNEAQPEYISFYKSKEWKRTRKSALTRDQYLCQRCLNEFGIYTVAEEVHHKIPTKTEEGWRNRLNLEGLVSLCRECHHAIESKR